MIRRFSSRWLKPTGIFDEVSSIDLDWLADQGVKGIVLDLDDTILGARAPIDGTPVAIAAWLQAAQGRFALYIVSNNQSRKRVKAVSELLGIPAIARAAKPRRSALRRAIIDMGLRPHEIAMIGDRVLTDVFVGRRMGACTCLVAPIEQKKPVWSKAIRATENWLMKMGDQ